ncbi:hypothetical protein KJ969_00965 [Patescibacteria group bacterium]|nr:hypothetical protein [Patescibacteria group bacterium]MBU1922433.1 hypothetical protein [Patescibacteria group bacterium]
MPKRPKDMPAWQDCTWRRIACEKPDCRICGKIMKQRQNHIERGEDPDSMEFVLQDVMEDLQETRDLIQKSAKHMVVDLSNLEDIDMPEPPRPDKYPLYKELMRWRKNVYDSMGKARQSKALWPDTDAARDLAWYANLLPVKTYRLLSDKWEIQNGDDLAKFDYDYTKYVVHECVNILEKSFSSLHTLAPSQKVVFLLLHSQFAYMLKRIKAI